MVNSQTVRLLMLPDTGHSGRAGSRRTGVSGRRKGV